MNKGLNRRDQTPGLNNDGRHALSVRRDPPRVVEVASEKRGGVP